MTFFAKRQLVGFREGMVQAAVIGFWLGDDGLDDGNQLGAQFAEQGADRFGFHAFIRKVDEGIGDVVVAGETIGDLAAEVEGFFQVGLHGRKIIGRPRLGPCLVSGG